MPRFLSHRTPHALPWFLVVITLSYAYPLTAPAQLKLRNAPPQLDPAAELAKQLSGEPTIKLKLKGKNYYGRPLAYDGNRLALLRWDGRVSALTVGKEPQVELIDRSFLPYTHEELVPRLEKEFGSRYTVSMTKHYVVVHPNGKAKIWADPFENLYVQFRHWFIDNGLEPAEPQFPLIAVVLRSRRDFDRFMDKEIDVNDRAIQGFYSNRTNRMVMFDPSSKLRLEDKTWLYRDITVVHEATHQTAFNTGVHQRFSPPPAWLAEGLAMLFETPGFNRSRQFPAAKHRVNRKRLAALRKLGTVSSVSSKMTGLITDKTMLKSEPLKFYTLAWGLTWFLAEERTDQLIKFLKKDASRKNYAKGRQADHVRLFASVFGNDLDALKRDLEAFYLKRF